MSDPRITPANSRVAHESLRGTRDAPRYTEGDVLRVSAPLADLHCTEGGERLDRQLVHGDAFRVLEHRNGLAFGISDRGGYVGYVAQTALAPWSAPSHWVLPRATLGFCAPDIKTPGPSFLTMGARISVSGHEGRMARSVDGLYIPAHHLAPLGAPAQDFVAQAETLLGTPYLWGGNSSAGLDCSGLVQASLIASGVPCPGDADLQEAALGEPIPAKAALQRGDLIFWKGHVGMMCDASTLLHANGSSMNVAYEPFGAACARIEAEGGGPVTSCKRL